MNYWQSHSAQNQSLLLYIMPVSVVGWISSALRTFATVRLTLGSKSRRLNLVNVSAMICFNWFVLTLAVLLLCFVIQISSFTIINVLEDIQWQKVNIFLQYNDGKLICIHVWIDFKTGVSCIWVYCREYLFLCNCLLELIPISITSVVAAVWKS